MNTDIETNANIEINKNKETKDMKIQEQKEIDTANVVDNTIKKFRENLRMSYSADSHKLTYYDGMLNQPVLAYNKEKGGFYFLAALSEHEAKDCQLDMTSQRLFKNYFTSALSDNYRQTNKHTLPDGTFKIVGIDLGLRQPFVGVVYEVRVELGQIVSHKFLRYIKANASENAGIKVEILHNLFDQIKALKSLLYETNKYFVTKKEEEIPDSYRPSFDRAAIAYGDILGIDMDMYRAYVHNFNNINELRHDKNWIISTLIKNLNSSPQKKCGKCGNIDNPTSEQCSKCGEPSRIVEKKCGKCGNIIQMEFMGDMIYRCPKCNNSITGIKDLRTEYTRIKKGEKKSYCKKNNYTDWTIFLKKKIILEYISLLRSFSTIGLKTSDTIGIRKNFAKTLYRWHKGLVRKCYLLSADIINVVRKEGAKVLFLEDLDIKTSIADNREENKLKALWGWGEIKKHLGHQARKHKIAVVAVNPHLTSLVHYETGLKCIETEGRMVTTIKDGKKICIDRDENAAHNIAIRGLYRHANLREFSVDQIDENVYRLNYSQYDGKQKKGALFHHLRTLKCAFVRDNDGVLIKKDLTPEEEKKGEINKKRTYIILHGDKWFLRHEIDEILERELR